MIFFTVFLGKADVSILSVGPGHRSILARVELPHTLGHPLTAHGTPALIVFTVYSGVNGRQGLVVS